MNYKAVTALILIMITSVSVYAECVIVDNGKPSSVIVISNNVHANTQLAADDLIYHVQRATGVTLKVVSPAEANNLSEKIVRIIIGDNTSSRELGIDVSQLSKEQFVVKTHGGSIVCAGNDEIAPASFWAVTYLLDRYLGVRWLWPGETGTHVPESDTIVLPDIDIISKPPLESRSVRLRRAGERKGEPRRWGLHHMMGNRSTYRFGHCFMEWWEKYGGSHPEYFAVLDDGLVQPHPVADRVKLCVSKQAVAERIIEDWKERGMPNNYCVGPNDGGSFCSCESCRALDTLVPGGEDPDARIMTGRYVSLWNKVLKRMKALSPDATLSSYAYSTYREPPVGMKLEEGIVLGFVHTYKAYEPWKQWHDAGAKLVLRPNWWHMGALAPHLPLHSVGNFFKFARENSMIGISFDSLMGYWGTQGPYYYMIARMSARPDLGVDDIIDEYVSAFGSAAPAMRDYIDFWERFAEEAAYTVPAGGSVSMDSDGLYERTVRKHRLPIHPLQGGWRVLPYMYKDDLLANAFAILDRAEKLTVCDPSIVRDRITFFRDGLEFLRLTRDTVALIWSEELPDGMSDTDVERKIRELKARGDELSERHVVWGDFVMNTMRRRGILTKKWVDMDGI
ncbi:DUF4838 domain-containing protein [Candidatus Latescibacterota bacterium]